MWPLKTLLYFVLFWLGCVAALFNPIWGVITYMVIYQINPIDTWWGRPLHELGLRFSLLAAAFTLVGLVTARRHVPRVRPSVSLWEVGAGLIVVCGALTLFIGYAYHPGSRFAFEKLWKMMLFLLIFLRLGCTRENLHRVFWCLTLGSLYIGWDAYTAPASAFWMGRLDRVGGTDFISTSGTAAHLGAMLPLIGIAFLTARRWIWRLTALAAGVLSVNAIILCRTRSAFVGLLCGVIVAALVAPRARRFRIHLLLTAGLIVGAALADSYFWARMGTLTNTQQLAQDEAAANRQEIWRHSLSLIAEHPEGVGPGNFRYVIAKYDPKFYLRSAHNTLIISFAEMGVYGGVLFLLLLAGSLRYLHRTARLAEQTAAPLDTKLMAYGCLLSFVTYTVTGLGTERFYCESFWWVLALPLCLYRMAVNESAANEPVPHLLPDDGTIGEDVSWRGFYRGSVDAE